MCLTVDTMVQPKNITFPTDAKLLHAAINGLNHIAQGTGCGCGNPIFVSPSEGGAMMAGRYAHAKRFNRHRRQLRRLRTRLGRLDPRHPP